MMGFVNISQSRKEIMIFVPNGCIDIDPVKENRVLNKYMCEYFWVISHGKFNLSRVSDVENVYKHYIIMR